MASPSCVDDTEADGKQGVSPYHLIPPPWRPSLSQDVSALDVPDFYGPAPGQPEADMSETSVKAGITSKPAVGNETFSAHDMIYDRLTTGGIAAQLGSFLREISLRKQELQRNFVEEPEYRLPPRVTLNPAKLNAYIKELADSSVPLHRLSRSIPHGYRGEQMLDMLSGDSASGGPAGVATNPGFASSTRPSVDVARAVWFIRAVGASEMQTARSRPNTNYTAESTVFVTNWLRKQLAELVLPANLAATVMTSGPHPPSPALTRPPLTPSRRVGQNAITSQTSGRELNALMEADHHRRWLSKWAYSTSLTRRLLAEGLLDQRVFLSWTLEMLAVANLSQLSIVLSLVQEFAEVYAAGTMLSRALVDTLATKMEELQRIPIQHDLLQELQSQMTTLLRRQLRAVPEAHYSPRFWRSHGLLLKTVLGASDDDAQRIVAESEEHVGRLLLDQFDTRATSETGYRKWCIERLEEFGPQTDFAELFNSLFGSMPGLAEQSVEAILLWASTLRHIGKHRAYLAANLLRHLVLCSTGAKTALADFQPLDTISDLNSILTRWLNEAIRANAAEEIASEQPKGEETDEPEEGAETSQPIITPRQETFAAVDLPTATLLFGELIRVGVFSYSKYLQRLAARGIIGPAHNGKSPSGTLSRAVGKSESAMHSRVLRSLPTYATSSALLHQRRTALYGSRTKETWEEATERRAVREVTAALPWLNHGPNDGTNNEHYQYSGNSEISDSIPSKGHNDNSASNVPRDVLSAVPHLQSGSRYVRIKVLNSHVVEPALDRAAAVDVQRCTALITLLNDLDDYAGLSALILALFDTAVAENVLRLLCAAVIENVTVWASLRTLPMMVSQIVLIHQRAGVVHAWDALSGTTTAISALESLGVLSAHDLSALLPHADPVNDAAHIAMPTNLAATLERLMRAPETLEDTITSLSLGPGITPDLVGALLPVSFEVAVWTDLPLSPLQHLFARLCQMTRTRLDQSLFDWANSKPFTNSTVEERVEVINEEQDRRVAELIVAFHVVGQIDILACFQSIFLPNLTPDADLRLASISLMVMELCILGERSDGDAKRDEQLIFLLAWRQSILIRQHVPLLVRLLCAQVTFERSGQEVVHCRAGALWRRLSSAAPIRKVVLQNLNMVLPRMATPTESSNPPRDNLQQVLSTLDPQCLLRTPSNEVTAASLSSRLGEWTSMQGAPELALVIQDLTGDPDPQSHRRIGTLAECAFGPLFGPDGNEEAGRKMLQEIGVGVFTARLVDIGMQGLSRTLEKLSPRQISSSDLELLQQRMAPLVRMQRASGRDAHVLPSVSVEASQAALSRVITFLEAHAQSAVQNDSGTGADDELYAVIQVLWLVVRISGSTSSKVLAARLLSVLGHLAIQRAANPADETIFSSLLDSIAYVQDQLPGDVGTSAVPSLQCIDQALAAPNSNGIPLPSHNAARLRRLSVQPIGRSALSDLILSRPVSEGTGFAAAAQADMGDAPLKPWTLLEHMHPPHVSRTNRDGLSESAPAAAAAILRLKDQGSLSLSLFGAVSTRDPVPTPASEIPDDLLQEYEYPAVNNQLPVEDVKVGWRILSSESGYGEQGAGDPIFAAAQRWGNNFLAGESGSLAPQHEASPDGTTERQSHTSGLLVQGHGSETDPVDLTESPPATNDGMLGPSAASSRKRKQQDGLIDQPASKAAKTGRDR